MTSDVLKCRRKSPERADGDGALADCVRMVRVTVAVQTNFMIDRRPGLSEDMADRDVLPQWHQDRGRDRLASLPCARIFEASGRGCRS
jgi:hypothetical protein